MPELALHFTQSSWLTVLAAISASASAMKARAWARITAGSDSFTPTSGVRPHSSSRARSSAAFCWMILPVMRRWYHGTEGPVIPYPAAPSRAETAEVAGNGLFSPSEKAPPCQGLAGAVTGAVTRRGARDSRWTARARWARAVRAAWPPYAAEGPADARQARP